MDERRWPGGTEFGDAAMGRPDSGYIDDTHDHIRETWATDGGVIGTC